MYYVGLQECRGKEEIENNMDLKIDLSLCFGLVFIVYERQKKDLKCIEEIFFMYIEWFFYFSFGIVMNFLLYYDRRMN